MLEDHGDPGTTAKTVESYRNSASDAEIAAKEVVSAVSAADSAYDEVKDIAKNADVMSKRAKDDVHATSMRAKEARNDAQRAEETRSTAKAQVAVKDRENAQEQGNEKSAADAKNALITAETAAIRAKFIAEAYESAAAASQSAADAVGAAVQAAHASRDAAQIGAVAVRSASDIASHAASAHKEAAAAGEAASRAACCAADATRAKTTTKDVAAARDGAAAAAAETLKIAIEPVKGERLDDRSSPRAGHSKKGMWLVIGGAILGLVLGAIVEVLAAELIATIGLVITLVVTVVTIGVSNDFPVAERLKKDKRLPWSLKTRHAWACASMVGLGFALMTTQLPNSETVAPTKCHVSVNEELPQLVMVQCDDGPASKIDLSGSKLSSEDRISTDDWEITDASTYISVDGSSVVEVQVSNDDEKCTYSRDLASPAMKLQVECVPRQGAENS